MRVSVIIPSFYPAKHYGGSIFATLDLYKNFSKNKDFSVYVSSTNANGNTVLRLGADGKSIVNNRFHDPGFGFNIKYYKEIFVNYFSIYFLFGIWSDIFKANIVHIQSIFSYPTPVSLFICFLLQKKVILSPRGSFAEWALKYKSYKKRIWLNFFISPFVNKITWHATSKKEKKEITKLYPKADVFIMPDGINVIDYSSFVVKEHMGDFEKIVPFDYYKNKKVILFLGRIHEVKGLDNLLYAFAKYKRYNKDSILIVAGDDHGFKNKLFALISELKLQNDVYFTGKVYGNAKKTLYKISDLFVLPSHTENFGIVVAEALASGLPVVASNKTPWEDLDVHKCGKFVDNNLDSLFNGMVSLLDVSSSELSQNAVEYAKFFDWDKIVKMYKNVLFEM